MEIKLLIFLFVLLLAGVYLALKNFIVSLNKRQISCHLLLKFKVALYNNAYINSNLLLVIINDLYIKATKYILKGEINISIKEVVR